jgi:hypothetical protein
MFREIRGVQQRAATGRKRWFQDEFFDLFITQNFIGKPQWFQLCYLRDTPWERVLEWKRGRGFQHFKLKQPFHSRSAESNVLIYDGVMPYHEVTQRFAASAPGLPAAIAAFVSDKVLEHERPSYRYRRPGARMPRWLLRVRRRPPL